MQRSLCVTLCLTFVSAIHAQSSPRTIDPIVILSERKTVQTLADGTHVTHVTHEAFYRDSKGRSLTKNEGTGAPGQGPVASFSLQDPTANESSFWNVGGGTNQEYIINKYPASMPSAPSPTPQLNAVVRPVIQHEDLGQAYVEGVACQASRTTTTYPVDTVGNDRAITVVNENCNSRELNRSLKYSLDDPRSGLTTVTVTAIVHGEPDPAVFLPPAGYTGRLSVTTVVAPTDVSAPSGTK